MNITSPVIDVIYRENGDGVGGTATEIITLPNGSKGTMLSVKWGSWDKASLQLVNYYDIDGLLVSGMVEARFDELSLFQLVTDSWAYTLDRSSVMLIYEKGPLEESLVLKQLQYAEKWGPKSKELAYGGYAVWTSRFDELLPSSYQKWGFWEKNGTPADQVKTVLESAMEAANRGIQPEFKAVDEDSGREVIGRQTGLKFYTSGIYAGRCDFTYKNTWGRQPNTMLIGSGALSRIGCHINNQSYFIVVLSPKISPTGSALYVFTTSEETADRLETQYNSDNASRLYDPLRRGEYEDVFLVTYGIGDIGEMNQSTEDGSVYIGDSGGVQWRTLGPVNYDSIVLASNLLALLGPAQYQTGLYYAYEPGSGSGLSYYLASLRIMYAPKKTVFRIYGQDVGVLDRVLVPDLEQFGIK
jgi:hypothetical protein